MHDGKLPIRKLMRLKEYNYSQSGYYFITICTHNKQCILGEVVDSKMHLNKYGLIVEKHLKIIDEYNNGFLDFYTIMPNHIHFIVVINDYLMNDNVTNRTKMLLPKIIQQFKSAVTKEFKTVGNALHAFRCDVKNIEKLNVWQKSYYEHIIRDEQSLIEIRQYIKFNASKWKEDKYYSQ